MRNEYITLGAAALIIVLLLLAANVSPFVDDYGTDYGIVASLDFEEPSGPTAYDVSPYGNDGTITGATRTDGKFGRALTFDGNDYVILPNSASLNLSSEITIEAWAKDPPIPFGAELGGDFNLTGNTVWVNDSRAYLSAQPHTLGSSGWVEFNLISKIFSGEIDVVWGFNQTISRPMRPQVWRNYTHTLWRWVETEETYLNETTGETYNYTGHEKEYYNSTFFDWKDFDKDKFVSPLKLDAKGMDTWHVLRNVHVDNGTMYKFRCWVEIPFAGNNIVQGKYAWGVKPSFVTLEDIKEGNKNFYFIDPWYNSQWLYRMDITVDSGDIDEVLTNFTVMVYLDASRIPWGHVQDDLDDIRFTSDDQVTLLSYEIEDHTVNTNAWLWVRLPTVSNTTDTVFYIYYGNPTASSGEDVEGTWDPSAVMVQHLQEATNSTCVDSTVYDNDGTPLPPGDPPVQVSGQVDGALEFDAVEDYVVVADADSLDITNPFTMLAWIKPTDTGFREIFSKGRHEGATGQNYRLNLDDGNKLQLVIGNVTDYRLKRSNAALTMDVLQFTGGVFVSTDDMRLYVDGSEVAGFYVGTATTLAVNDNELRIGRAFLASWFNGTIDEVRLYDVAFTPTQIKATYESERDDLLTFGTEVIEKIIVQKLGAYTLGISNAPKLIGIINTTVITANIDKVTSWHYYSMTYDGSYLRLYIDGREVNSVALTGAIAVNANDVIIGNRFLGEIDQVRIYSVAKTVGEIRNHYLNTGGMYSGSIIVSDDFRVLNTTLDEQLTLEDGHLNITGSGEFGGILDMNLNYILYFPHRDYIHISMIAGLTDVSVVSIPPGEHDQDEHYYMMMLSLDVAPGAGKTVNATISDGTNTMFVAISDGNTFGSTEIGAFTLDVSAEAMTITYSQTAGGATTFGCLMFHFYYVENE